MCPRQHPYQHDQIQLAEHTTHDCNMSIAQYELAKYAFHTDWISYIMNTFVVGSFKTELRQEPLPLTCLLDSRTVGFLFR